MDNQSSTPENKDENETGGTSIDVVSRPSLSDVSPPSTTPDSDSSATPPSPALSAPAGKVSSGSGGKGKSKLMPVLLTILIIIIFVGGIYGVYAWQHSKVTSLTSQVNTLNSQVNSLNKEVSKQTSVSITTPSTSATTASTTVFKIPELGIQFTVPSTLADLTYAANSAGTVANLSTQTLTDLDAACTANATTGLALGNVSKTTGQFKTTAGVTLIKQYPTYYISYTAAPSACSKDAETNALTTTLTTQLKTTFATIATTSS